MTDKIVMLRQQARRLAAASHPSHSGGYEGSGGGGSDMEVRIAKLEALAESTDRRLATVETDLRDLRKDVQSDFRLTWTGIIALGLMLGGAWFLMDARLDSIDGRLGAMDGRLNGMEGRLSSMDDRLSDIEGTLKAINGKLTQ